MTTQNILHGGGQNGELIRKMDWSGTLVGPIEKWSPTLKTMVNMLLASQFPMFLWWGPEHVQFYNDAYRDILGDGGKHPAAMGQRAEESWSEIWHIIKPLINKVMETGESVWSEDDLIPIHRAGYLDEVFWTFSYSAVRDETGNIAGVLVVCAETTKKVLSGRRLLMLRDLAARTVEAKHKDEACNIAGQVLSENPADIAYALIYTFNKDKTKLELTCNTNLYNHPDLSPDIIELSDDVWPIKEVADTGIFKLVEKLKDKENDIFCKQWPEACSTAIVLPIVQNTQSNLQGILIIGISPRKAFDNDYRQFLELTASGLCTAIVNATAYEEEKRRAEALEEIDRTKTTFFSNISHEFRTPLTLMVSPLEEVLDEGALIPKDVKENIKIVYDNTKRLQKLVNTLLDFSAIEAGRLNASYQLTNVSRLTKELASGFRSAIEKAGMQLNVDCDFDIPDVYVDRDMWEKIVLNLISNAFKYSHKGKIDISIKPDGAFVELQVSDTGIGIPKNQLNKIFERFHRIENGRGRSKEGSGIGLAMVKELVKQHHGTITVLSEQDQGSVFTVRIPIGKQHLQQDKISQVQDDLPSSGNALNYINEASKWINTSLQEKQNKAGENQSNTSTKPFVLLADDNEDMRNYIKRLLSAKYDVEVVATGKEALESIENKKPALILSDVMMPEMDGFELTKILKSKPQTENIPILLLSARAGEEATVEGLATGADDYLTKPFSAKELLSRIESNIKIAQTRISAEENLHNIFMQSPFAIVILRGPDFIIELANSKALELWDRTEEQVMSKQIFESFPELEKQGFAKILSDVYTTGNKYESIETPIKLFRYGKLEDAFINFVYEPLRDTDGCITGIIGVGVDVSREIDARLKIQEKESLFRSLVMQIPVAITIFRGPDFMVELANDTYLQIVGRTKEQFVGRPLLEGLPEVGSQGIPELLTGVLETGIPYYGKEYPVDIHRNGKDEKCYFNFVYYPLKNSEDEIDGIIVAANEVTEQVMASKKIADSENKFRSVVMQSPMAITILKGEDMVVELANTVLLESYWDKKSEDVIGRKLIEIFPELKDQMFPGLLQKVYETGIRHRDREAVAYIAGDSGMKRLILDFEYAPIYGTENEVSGVMITANDVTAKVEARQKIEDAETRLRLAAEATGLGTWDLDLETDHLIHSPRIAEIFGHETYHIMAHEELMKQVYKDDLMQVLNPAFEVAMETGIYNYEARIVLPDSSLRWIRTQGKVMFDEVGKAMRMIGTTRDITDQKNDRKALEENELLFKTITTASPVGLWMTNDKGDNTFVNKTWSNWSGTLYNTENAYSWVDALLEEDKERTIKKFLKCFAVKEPFVAEFKFKRIDGAIRWGVTEGSPYSDLEGNFAGYVGSVTDITERKHTEEKLINTNQTLALALQAGSLGSYEMQLGSGVIICTERCKANFGREAQDVFNYKELLEAIVPEDRDRMEATLNTALANDNIYSVEYRVKWPDDTIHWISASGIGVYDMHHKIIKVTGVTIDITDQKMQAEKLEKTVEKRTRELQQSNYKLEQTNHELEQYAYVASHDLQEPLRKIRTYAGILNESLAKENEGAYVNVLHKIMQSAERMSDLIYDLLNFSRLLNPETTFLSTDLNLIVANVINDFELNILQKKAKVVVDELPVIEGVPLQMNQLFYNLISNALKFSGEKEAPEIYISVRPMTKKLIEERPKLDSKLNYVDITLTDNGIGFSQNDADQIFEVFKRLHNKHLFPGSGIGLALCRRIVLNHKGDIYAEGAEGKGAIFHVILPLKQLEQS